MQKYTRFRHLSGKLYVFECLTFLLISAVFAAVVFPMINKLRVHHAVSDVHHLLIATMSLWIVTGLWIYLTAKITSGTSKLKTLVRSVEGILLFCTAVTFMPFILLASLALRWYIHFMG